MSRSVISLKCVYCVNSIWKVHFHQTDKSQRTNDFIDIPLSAQWWKKRYILRYIFKTTSSLIGMFWIWHLFYNDSNWSYDLPQLWFTTWHKSKRVLKHHTAASNPNHTLYNYTNICWGATGSDPWPLHYMSCSWGVLRHQLSSSYLLYEVPSLLSRLSDHREKKGWIQRSKTFNCS